MDIPFDNKDFVDYLRKCSKKARKRVFEQIKENDTNKVNSLYQLGSRSVVNLKRLKISNNRNTYHTFKRNTHCDTNHKLKMNILSIHKTSANINNSDQVKFSTNSVHKTIITKSETKEIEKSYIEETISSSLSDKRTQYSNIKTQNTDSNICNKMNSTSISRKEEKNRNGNRNEKSSKTLSSRNEDNNKLVSSRIEKNKAPSRLKDDPNKTPRQSQKISDIVAKGTSQLRPRNIEKEGEKNVAVEDVHLIETHLSKYTNVVNVDSDNGLQQARNSVIIRTPSLKESKHSPKSQEQLETTPKNDKLSSAQRFSSSKNFNKRLDEGEHLCHDKRLLEGVNSEYMRLKKSNLFETQDANPEHTDKKVEMKSLHQKQKAQEYYFSDISSHDGDDSEESLSNATYSPINIVSIAQNIRSLPNHEPVENDINILMDEMLETVEIYLDPKRDTYVLQTEMVESPKPISTTIIQVDDLVSSSVGPKSQEKKTTFSNQKSSSLESENVPSEKNKESTILENNSQIKQSSVSQSDNINSIVEKYNSIVPTNITSGIPKRRSSVICSTNKITSSTTSESNDSNPSTLKQSSEIQSRDITARKSFQSNENILSACVAQSLENNNITTNKDPSKPSSIYDFPKENTTNIKSIISSNDLLKPSRGTIICETGLPERTLNSTSVSECEVLANQSNCDIPNVQNISLNNSMKLTNESKIIQSKPLHSILKMNSAIQENSLVNFDDSSNSSDTIDAAKICNYRRKTINECSAPAHSSLWLDGIPQSTYVTFDEIIKNSKQLLSDNKPIDFVTPLMVATTGWSTPQVIDIPVKDPSQSRVYSSPFKWINMKNLQKTISPDDEKSDSSIVLKPKEADNHVALKWKESINQFNGSSKLYSKNKCLLKRRHSVMESTAPTTSAGSSESIGDWKNDNNASCSKPYQVPKRRNSAAVKSLIDIPTTNIEESVGHSKKDNKDNDDCSYPIKKRRNSTVRESEDNQKNKIEESSPSNCETIAQLEKGDSDGCSKTYQISKRWNSTVKSSVDNQTNKVEPSVSNCETSDHLKKGNNNNKDNEGSTTCQISRRRISNVKPSIDNHKINIESSVSNCETSDRLKKENNNKGNESCFKIYQVPKRRNSAVKVDDHKKEIEKSSVEISHFKRGNTNTDKDNYSNMSQPKRRNSAVKPTVANHENKTNESTVGNCESIKHLNKENNKDNEGCSKTNQIQKRRNSAVKPSIDNNKNKIEQSLVGNCETNDLKKGNNNKDNKGCSKTNQISKRRNSAVKPSVGNNINKIEQSLIGNCETIDLKKGNNNFDNEDCLKTYHIPKRRHSTVEKSVDIRKTNIEEQLKKKSRHSNENNPVSSFDKQSNLKRTLIDKSVDTRKTKIESFNKKSQYSANNTENSSGKSNLKTPENDKSFSKELKNVNTSKSNNVPQGGLKSNWRTDVHSIKENKEARAQCSTQMSMPLLDDFSDQLSKPDQVYHKKHIPAILRRNSNIDDTRTRISDDKSTKKRILDQSSRSKQTYNITDNKLNVKINLNHINVDELFQNKFPKIDESLQVKRIANIKENATITPNENPIKVTANDSNNGSNGKNDRITELVENPEETEDLPLFPKIATSEFLHLPEYHNVQMIQRSNNLPNSTDNIIETDLRNQTKRKDPIQLLDKSAAIESRVPVDSTTELQHVKSNADILKDSNLRDQIIVKSNSEKESPKILETKIIHSNTKGLALDLFNIPSVTSSLRENFIKNSNEPVILLTLENAAEHISDVFIATMNNCTMLKWLQAQMSKCPQQFVKMMPKLKYVADSIIDFYKRATSIQVRTFDMNQFCVVLNNKVNQRLSRSNQLKSHKFLKEMFQVISLVVQYSPLTENKTNLYYLLSENIDKIYNVPNSISDKNTNAVETAIDLTTSRANHILEQSTKTTTNSSPVTSSPQIQIVDWSNIDQTKSYLLSNIDQTKSYLQPNIDQTKSYLLPNIDQTKSYLLPNNQQKSSNKIIPTCVQRTSFDTYKVKFTEQSVINVNENTSQILTSTNSLNSESLNVSALQHCTISGETADINKNTVTTCIPDIQLQNITTEKQNCSPNNVDGIYQPPTLNTTDKSKAQNISTIQNKLNDDVLIRAKTPTTENPNINNQNISNLRNILTQGKTCTSNIQQSKTSNLPTSNDANTPHTFHNFASNVQEVNKLGPETIHDLSKPTCNSITSNSQNISTCDNTVNQQIIPVFNTQVAQRKNLQNSIKTANSVHGNIALLKNTAKQRNMSNSNSQPVNTLEIENNPTHINNMGPRNNASSLNGDVVQQISVLNTQNNVHSESSVLQNLPTKQFSYPINANEPIQQPLNSYGFPPAYNIMNDSEYIRRLQYDYECYIRSQEKLGVGNPLQNSQEMSFLENHLKISAGNQLEYECNFETYKKWWEYMHYNQYYSKIQPHQQQQSLQQQQPHQQQQQQSLQHQPHQQQQQQSLQHQPLQQLQQLVQYPQQFYQTSATNPPISANSMASSRSSRAHHKSASYYQQATHISQNLQLVNHTNHQHISSLNIQTASNFRQRQSTSTTQRHPVSHTISTITSSQKIQNCTKSKSKNVTQSSNSAPTYPNEQHCPIVQQNLSRTQRQNNSIDQIPNVFIPANNITINQNIYHNNKSTMIQVLPEQNQVILESNQNNIRQESRQRVVSSIPEYHQISKENIQYRTSHQLTNKKLKKVVESSILNTPNDNYQIQVRNIQNNQLNMQKISNNTSNPCNLISVPDRISPQYHNIDQILDNAIEEPGLDNQIPANRITQKNSNHKIDQILNNQNASAISITEVVKDVGTNVTQTSSTSIQATSTWIPTTCSVNTYNQTVQNSNLSSACSNVNPVTTSVFQSKSSSNLSYFTGGISTVNHIPNEIASSASEYIDVGMLRNIRIAGAGSSSSIQQLQGNSRNLPRIESTDSGYTSPVDPHPQPQTSCLDQCEMCSEPGNFLCSGCQTIHYCSQQCQC